jgi:hypothetical protein
VQDQQVDLVDAELAGALVNAVQRLVVSVVADPDLGLQENLRPVQAGLVDRLADLALVAVSRRGIDVAVPGAEFRYGSAQIANLMPAYDNTPAHSFLTMLDPAGGLAAGDPARMAARIIESIDTQPAPLRLVLGSQALQSTLATLRKRIADLETQTELAASTDFPPGE